MGADKVNIEPKFDTNRVSGANVVAWVVLSYHHDNAGITTPILSAALTPTEWDALGDDAMNASATVWNATATSILGSWWANDVVASDRADVRAIIADWWDHMQGTFGLP